MYKEAKPRAKKNRAFMLRKTSKEKSKTAQQNNILAEKKKQNKQISSKRQF